MIWRNRASGDELELRAAHLRQCVALGIEFPFPDFDDPRYIAVWVAEEDGKAVGAIAIHATVEVMFIGGNSRMVRSVVALRAALTQGLRRLGCDEMHAFVPLRCLARMEPILRRLGFRRSNEAYKPFYREV